jgi:hypothetical protein
MTPAKATMRTRRVGIRRGVLASVVVLVVVSTYQLFSIESAFVWGNEVSGPSRVGEPVLVGMGNTSPAQTVTVRGARPVVRENSADAQIQIMICRKRAATGLILIRGAARPSCRKTVTADGYVLRRSAHDREFIMARVVARQPGEVHLDGVDVAYSRGWRDLWMTRHGRAGIEAKLSFD